MREEVGDAGGVRNEAERDGGPRAWAVRGGTQSPGSHSVPHSHPSIAATPPLV